MKIVQNENEAWAAQEKYKGKPHGWIQFKGTDLCMDIHCECGFLSHIDSEFVYYVKCPKCGNVYALNGHIEFIKVITEPENCVHMGLR